MTTLGHECARKWFFQGCLNNGEDSTFNCPECRQDHVQLSLDVCGDVSLRGGGSVGSSRCGEEISCTSFFHVGQSLIAEGGYDFMSDVGSESTRYTASSVGLATGNNTPARKITKPSPPPPLAATTTVAVSVLLEEEESASPIKSLSTAVSAVTEVRGVDLEASSSRVDRRLAESTYSDCGVPFV
eukprot:gene25072-31484_t